MSRFVSISIQKLPKKSGQIPKKIGPSLKLGAPLKVKIADGTKWKMKQLKLLELMPKLAGSTLKNLETKTLQNPQIIPISKHTPITPLKPPNTPRFPSIFQYVLRFPKNRKNSNAP